MENTSHTTREFTLRFLQDITNNFSKEHVIGSGGYGVVYRGVLENGEEIAIKKLHFMPGLDDTQFRNEFNNLMRVQHKNITRLVGYCYHLGHERIMYNGEYVFAHVEERVLCLEYLQHGSLDKYISDESCGLDWRTRYKIIKGVCEGLNYLHNGYKDPIYHMDLKPANILLDKDMTPKIGDFGLSRLFPSAHTYTTIKIIGTPGYMPPEYIDKYEITSKFDVFSLGATIIRIIAGDEGYSKHANMSSQEFVEHVHENWRKRMREIMTSHTSLEVMTCIEIALRCVEADRVRRPTISEIVIELNEIYTVESSPISQWLGAEHTKDDHGFEYSDDEPIVAPPCSGTRVQLVVKKYGNNAPLYENTKKVMLQLTRGGSVGRLGLDMVVVLDISGSMQGKKIQEMKTTMKFIIDKLSPIDRLSIVTFSAAASRICPLRLITETCLPELQGLIDSLKASGDAANIIDGLQTGFKVLANRKVSRGRVVAVMIMSDGLQISRGSQVDVDGNDVPVYTFGFGADHDPMVLHEIADKSNGGTFSVVMQDMEGLSLAFSRCLDSLLTVVVQDLRLTVESVEKECNVPIRVITDGSHPQTQDANHGSVTISLGNLSSREVRKVTVDLLLLAIRSERSTDILKITYSYSTFGELFVAPPLMITVWRTNTSMVVPEKEKPSLDRDMQDDHGFEYSDDEPIVGPPCSVKLMIKKYGNEAPLYENNKEVMVQLTRGGYVGRLELDMVVILDVSGSMQGKKIQEMKTTMKFIIDKLGPIDRLSIVTFSAVAARLCPLRLITETSQSELQGLIDGLTASGDAANIIEGLQTGLKVLADRKVSRCRVVAVMIMSDGLQTNRGSQIDVDCNYVPIYTFGFGVDHDPTVLHEVAYKSNGGTFSAVIPYMDGLSLPFSQCLDNLLNVVVQDLRLMVESVEKECNVPIKVITDGSYPQAKEVSLGSATVSLRNFYGRKVLNITVSILQPAIKSKHRKEIFKITYSYSTVGEQFVVPLSTLAVWRTSTGMAVLEKEKPPAVPTAEAQVHQMVKKTSTEAATSSYDLSYCHPERPPARAQADYDIFMKLVVVGNSGVGKSIIVSQFVDGSFSTSFISTFGIDLKKKTVELGGRRINLHIWDTAGQERYRLSTGVCYRGASGILLVYDVTNESSFNSIIKWNKEIEEYATDANKILVGNRIDMAESRRAVPTSRGKALADEYGIKFFETSAKTNLNVEQAFFYLVRDVMARLPPPETDPMPMVRETDPMPLDPTIKMETSQRRHRNPLAYARELLSKKK